MFAGILTTRCRNIMHLKQELCTCVPTHFFCELCGLSVISVQCIYNWILTYHNTMSLCTQQLKPWNLQYALQQMVRTACIYGLVLTTMHMYSFSAVQQRQNPPRRPTPVRMSVSKKCLQSSTGQARTSTVTHVLNSCYLIHGFSGSCSDIIRTIPDVMLTAAQCTSTISFCRGDATTLQLFVEVHT